ncbi:MAG: hypothetical protein HC904_00520 [Blastochloris sp.]|nr:hypothetical protein [Blastochloris sp.]
MILWIALVLIAVAYRLVSPQVDGLENFAPLMAISLCAAIYLPRRWAFSLPLLALIFSDLLLNSYYGVALFQPYLIATSSCYLLVGLLGLWVSSQKSLITIFGSCLLSTVFFYLVTNTIAFVLNPIYAPNLSGWLQALTVGDLIHQPQTWVFLRNSLFSDLLFTAIFVGSMEFAASRRQSASFLFPSKTALN